jgi:hypothetical protein
VHAPVVLVVVVLAGLAALAGAWTAVRDRPPGRVALVAAAVAELAVVVQSVVALAAVVGGHRPTETVTTVAYLLGITVVLPLAAAWAMLERTRWSGAVLAVGALTVAVMTARSSMLWQATGG